MAEAVLIDVAGDIIRKLGSPALKEIGLLWGVKDELEKLSDTVSTIQAVLLDAEEQYEKSHQVRVWIDRLKDAVYDADDLLDDFSTETMQGEVMSSNKMAKQVRIFFSSSNQLAFRLKMGHKIKAIRERLDAVAADRKFHLMERTVEPQVESREWRQTHSYVREEEVIGRENDKKSIIELLLDSNVEENVSIIPIVGIGGLGKTTLAQYVFNDEDVIKHFEPRMWACVSDNFNLKAIVEKVIKSATNKEPGNLEMDQLQNMLRKETNGKKYLLVLDDVWNDDREKWLSLKKLLMGGATGSRILVTTREEKVAKIISTISPYVLKGLPEKESWSLFVQIAFERGQESKNPVLVGIGKEIVRKCVGVPLAIRTIGSLLYLKKTETEWQSFKNNELSKIAQKENDILPTLMLSYDHLPSYLKHCFAYCRLFPKDHEIDIQVMINLWVAQGFIKLSLPSQCLEDVGYEYFVELFWRSFFQEAKENEYGRVVNCKMHDLMHDLAIQVAGRESTSLNSIAENIDEKTRYMSFNFNFESSMEFSRALLKANKLQTFLMPSNPEWDENKEILSNSIWDAIVSSFRSLRVLDLHNCGIKTVPKSIRKLKRLRYLDLSNNKGIKMLPSSITKLKNLQTLKLSRCEELKELPKDMQKMVSLRHLEIDECSKLTHMPCGLGQLTSLQTLTLFVAARDNSMSKLSGGLNELNGLNNLRGELKIKNLDRVKDTSEFKAANLKEKQCLESLELEWNPLCNDGVDVVDDEMSLEYLQPHPNLKGLYVYGYRGVMFPDWLSSVTTHLVTITMRNCIRCQYLPPLDKLHSLKTLALSGLTNLEYVSDNIGSYEFSLASCFSVATFFSSLQELRLYDCPNLKGWWREDGTSATTTTTSSMLLPSFPSLSSLHIWDCPKLTSMPLFPYLERELWLRNTSVKPLQHTITTTVAATTSPLSKLKSMRIEEIKDLESLPEEWLQNLSSLKDLNIFRCRRLAGTLSRGIQHLSSLEDLQIMSCEELCLSHDEVDDDGIQWKALRSLSSMWIAGFPKLESLPEGLQHVTTLQLLRIWGCRNLMALPEWIGCLASLQFLWINHCPNLESLPKGMRSLTSLQHLLINNCPILKERCQKEKGEDWPKIAHIPSIEIDYEQIQH